MATYSGTIDLRVTGNAEEKAKKIERSVKSLQDLAKSLKPIPNLFDNRTQDKGIRKAKEELKKLVGEYGRGTRAGKRFSNTLAGLNSQISAFGRIIGNVNTNSDEFVSAITAQEKASRRLARAEADRLRVQTQVNTANTVGRATSVQETLDLGKVIPKSIAGLDLYQRELEETFRNVRIGSQDYKDLSLAIADVNRQLAFARGERPVQGPALPPGFNERGRIPSPGRSRNRLQDIATGTGFPLLFGGGPFQALAGGIGGAFGGLGGSIAGSAIAAQFEAIGRAAADLGNALDPLTFDLEAVSTAAGVAGTETAQFLEKIEKYGSATEAARLATALLETKIGQNGVQALKDFGDSATDLGNALSTIFTQVLANIAKAAGPLLESLARFAGEQADVGAFLERTGLTGQEKLAQEILGTPFQVRQGELTTASFRALSGFSARSREFGGEGFQTAEQALKFATGVATSSQRKFEMPVLQEIESIAAGVQTPEDKRAAKPLEQQEAKAARLLQLAKDRSLLAEAMTDQEKRSIQLVIKKEKIDRELNLVSKEKRDAIKEELDTTFMITNITETRKEQEKALADAAEKRRKAEKDAAEKLQSIYDQLGATIAQGVVGSIQAAVDGTKSLAEVASNTLRNLANQLLTLGVNTLLKSTGAGIFSNLPGFANGGRPPVGKPSIVGERGPELFVPRTSGTIVPNHAMGGATVNVAVDASGSSVEGDADQAGQLGKAIGVAVQQELIKQKRPGGLLAV